DGDDWDVHLNQVQWSINNTQHSVTQRTPYEIIFNKRGIGIHTDQLTREIIEFNETLDTVDERKPVSELLEENRVKQKEYFDKRRKSPYLYEKGDIVMVRSEPQATGQSKKLEVKYKGPYEIVKSLGNDRYLVQDIEGEQQSNRLYKAIVAVDKIKLVTKAP
ncbi:hypothetical protein KPH14_000794, partial [Odynerus spinipes]